MRCHKCGYNDTRVMVTKSCKKQPMRERRCIACGERFPTLEVIKGDDEMVLWRDEEYNLVRLEIEAKRLGVRLRGGDEE